MPAASPRIVSKGCQVPDPVVDVVVATNRRSPYLAEALASVAQQTYPSWRLILVDDGCPDPEFIDEAARHMPGSLVVRTAATGVSAARNRGCEVGDGELIALLDDDDVWAHGKLAAQVSALAKSPDSVACFTAGWYMDAAGVPFGDGWSATQATRGQFLCGSAPTPRIVSLVVRRAAWEAIGGFDTSYSMAEDNEFILRLIQLGALTAVAEPLVGYRRHSFNTSTAGGLRERLANRRVFVEHVAAARRRGDDPTAALLLERLSAHQGEWAEETVRGVAAAGRRRDLRSVFMQLAWGLRVAPVGTVTTAFRMSRKRKGSVPARS